MANTVYLSLYLLRKTVVNQHIVHQYADLMQDLQISVSCYFLNCHSLLMVPFMSHVLLSTRTDVNVPGRYCHNGSGILKISLEAKGNTVHTGIYCSSS